MPNQLPLKALRAFECTARHLSIREAAEELHVTPAAISQQIKQLEELLGVPLFHRLGRGLELTNAGAGALPFLADGFNSLREGMSQMQKADNGTTLNVWMAPSFATKWLIPRMPSFTQEHPDINLCISASVDWVDQHDTSIGFADELFKRQEVDVAIRFGSGRSVSCRVDKMMTVSVAPLCSPALPDAAEHALEKPDDLAHFTLLHDDSPYEGRPDWPSWLRANRVTKVDGRKGLRFNQGSFALTAAAEGQGVVLGLDKLAEHDIANNRLIAPFDNDTPVDSAYYVFSRKGDNQSSAARLFHDWLIAEATRPVSEA
jgi:LysR family glycine cleavage system transcriptional activator